MIGSELVRLLSHRGHSIQALTRQPEGQQVLTGVEWVEVDLADGESLSSHLQGAENLFLLTGNAADMVQLQTNVIEAASKAGIQRVVKLSALGASDHSKSIIGVWHHVVESKLRRSGIAWTILRPHHFMQNLLDPLVYDRGKGELRSASGEGAIPFIDTRDVASVAAAVLTERGHEASTYSLTGLRARSYREAAQVLSRALGHKIGYRSESVDEAWERRRRAGQPPWLAAAQLEIARYQRAGGPTTRTTDAVQRLTGRLPRTLHQFAEDHAAVLS